MIFSSNTDRYAILTFDPKGEIWYIFFYVRENNASYNTPPSGVEGNAIFTGSRAKGRLFMKKPSEAMDEQYQFDVTFDTDIVWK